ncbi:MAG: hypothetical protein U9N54_10295 [candidate division Zixibacteria bacterium]|nr:hypothetical protein [candidate division Zixibacteria bacterium]
MNRRTFTKEQIKKISKNKNVSRCGTKSVMYAKSFKTKALRQYNEEGLSAVEIFKEAGFNLSIIGIRRPNKLMNQWNTALRSKRKPETPLHKAKLIAKRMGSGREIRILKDKVSYLEAENDFLAQLRAQKRK